MKKPPKVKNQAALEDWDNYVNDFKIMPDRQAAFLPLNVDIEDGKISRELILASSMEVYYPKIKNDIPDYMRSYSEMTPTMTEFPNIDKVVQHYIDNINDGSHSGGALTPLDIETNRPTYILFRLSRKDNTAKGNQFLKWRFSEDKQITCHNDGVGPFRNVLPICTLDDGKVLLAYNRHRSDPSTMKYDLHVTIHQKANLGTKKKAKWVDVKTPIIIDPGLGNGGHGLP